MEKYDTLKVAIIAAIGREMVEREDCRSLTYTLAGEATKEGTKELKR
jgi:hypothetical protein